MENTMDILHSFGRKGFSLLIAFQTAVVELLDVLGGEGFQLDCTKSRLNVVLDSCLVGTDGGEF